MMKKLRKILESTEFILVVGLVVIPLLSFAFIQISPESPLYTSISRIIWVHGYWIAACVWALIVMGVIAFLTCRLIHTSVL